MRFASRPAAIKTLLTLAILSTVAVVLACAPAAPALQRDKPTPTPTNTPTPTPEIVYLPVKGTLTPFQVHPTTPPGAAVHAGLMFEADRYLATREAQEAKGQRSVDASPTHTMIIFLQNTEDIPGVVEMLEAGGAEVHNAYPATDQSPTHIGAIIPVSMFHDIEADERITLIEHALQLIHYGAPAAPNGRKSTPCPQQPPNQASSNPDS